MDERKRFVEPPLGAAELKRLREEVNAAAGRLRTLRIGVICGGDTAEREVSLVSGRGIYSALAADGLKARLIDLHPARLAALKLAGGAEQMLAGETGGPLNTGSSSGQPDGGGMAALQEVAEAYGLAQADVVFLALHGGAGEDGHVQALLDLAGVPYVGTGVLASAVGMHKPTFKLIVQALGLRTPPAVTLHRGDDPERKLAPLMGAGELVIKPASEGSSVGVRIVQAQEAAASAQESLLDYPELVVEQRIRGTEVTASVLGRHRRPVVLPHVEIEPVAQSFYDYKAKYTRGETNYIIPARLPAEVAREFAESAAVLQDALRLVPYSRIDAMVSQEGAIYFLEVNTLPGFTPLSLVPQAAAAAGIEYAELLRILVFLTLEAVGR